MLWIFTEDLKTKAVALVCAVFIWFLVSGLISDHMERVVPIQVESVDRVGTWAESPTEYLRVTLEGPRESLRSLEPERLARPYTVEPDQLGPGEGSKVLDLPAEDFVDLPPGIRATKIDPPRIRIDVHRVVLRHLSIRAEVRGEPAPGFKVGEVALSPSEIRALVPLDVTDREFARTMPVEVTGRDHAFTQRVQVVPEIEGRRIYLQDDRPVQVRVGIEELADEAEVELEVLVLMPPLYPLRLKEIDPKSVRIRVSGPKTRLAAAQGVRLFVNLDDLELDLIRKDIEYPHYFDLRVDVPAGLRVAEKYIVNGMGQKEMVQRVKLLFVEP